jgi:hypothetical protein
MVCDEPARLSIDDHAGLELPISPTSNGSARCARCCREAAKLGALRDGADHRCKRSPENAADRKNSTGSVVDTDIENLPQCCSELLDFPVRRLRRWLPRLGGRRCFLVQLRERARGGRGRATLRKHRVSSPALRKAPLWHKVYQWEYFGQRVWAACRDAIAIVACSRKSECADVVRTVPRLMRQAKRNRPIGRVRQDLHRR